MFWKRSDRQRGKNCWVRRCALGWIGCVQGSSKQLREKSEMNESIKPLNFVYFCFSNKRNKNINDRGRWFFGLKTLPLFRLPLLNVRTKYCNGKPSPNENGQKRTFLSRMSFVRRCSTAASTFIYFAIRWLYFILVLILILILYLVRRCWCHVAELATRNSLIQPTIGQPAAIITIILAKYSIRQNGFSPRYS